MFGTATQIYPPPDSTGTGGVFPGGPGHVGNGLVGWGVGVGVGVGEAVGVFVTVGEGEVKNVAMAVGVAVPVGR